MHSVRVGCGVWGAGGENCSENGKRVFPSESWMGRRDGCGKGSNGVTRLEEGSGVAVGMGLRGGRERTQQSRAFVENGGRGRGGSSSTFSLLGTLPTFPPNPAAVAADGCCSAAFVSLSHTHTQARARSHSDFVSLPLSLSHALSFRSLTISLSHTHTEFPPPPSHTHLHRSQLAAVTAATTGATARHASNSVRSRCGTAGAVCRAAAAAACYCVLRIAEERCSTRRGALEDKAATSVHRYLRNFVAAAVSPRAACAEQESCVLPCTTENIA